ncbi:hypothetical protein AB0J01_28250 [Streptomyces sp. NPDC050204]|uniref:hypothetical protein n=1 Tax=Streptomyces sp. NPDC050204 TaxID=3155514 RepID=UPI003424021D
MLAVRNADTCPTRSAAVPLLGDGFRSGDIVAVDGRQGEWELMARAWTPGVWQVEPARPDGRERDEVPVSALRALADGPHVRRGDLVMQSYAEQELAAEVGTVYRQGYHWMAQKLFTLGGRTWRASDDEVDRLVVVTPAQMESALRLVRETAGHRGRIVQAIVTRYAGMFRLTCQCLPGVDICRKGRQRGWCSTLEDAQALWEWHAAGERGGAPADSGRVPGPDPISR